MISLFTIKCSLLKNCSTVVTIPMKVILYLSREERCLYYFLETWLKCIKNILLCFPTIHSKSSVTKLLVNVETIRICSSIQKIVAKILKVTETLSLPDEPATKTTWFRNSLQDVVLKNFWKTFSILTHN